MTWTATLQRLEAVNIVAGCRIACKVIQRSHEHLRWSGARGRLSTGAREHDSNRRGHSGRAVPLQAGGGHAQHRAAARAHRGRPRLSTARPRQPDRRPDEGQLSSTDAELWRRREPAAHESRDDCVPHERRRAVCVLPRRPVGRVPQRGGHDAARRRPFIQDPHDDAAVGQGTRDAPPRSAHAARADDRHHAASHPRGAGADGAGAAGRGGSGDRPGSAGGDVTARQAPGPPATPAISGRSVRRRWHFSGR